MGSRSQGNLVGKMFLRRGKSPRIFYLVAMGSTTCQNREKLVNVICGQERLHLILNFGENLYKSGKDLLCCCCSVPTGIR